MKLLKSKSVITVLAMAGCGLLIFFAYRSRVDKAIRAKSVPVAKTTLEARQKITSEDFKVVKVAGSMITDNVITRVSEIEDKYVNYNTMIPEGSLFYKEAVVDWSHMPDSTWASIRDENTVVSISVNVESTFGNSIYPNDKIDLYYQARNADNELFVGKLIEGIKVLAVKDSNGQHIFKRTANQTSASQLIFQVPEDMHLLLRKGLYVNGEIIPVPRNANYSAGDEVSEVTSEYIKDYILNQCWDLKPDTISDQTTNNINNNGNNNSNNPNSGF